MDIRPRIESEFFKKAIEDPINAWRIFRIMSEFVQGFELIRKYKKAATIFGASQYKPEDQMYKEAETLAKRLSEDHFTVITGGGPGIMEAANKGAFQAGKGLSIGLNIDIPIEEAHNHWVHESFNFHYFFTRKVMLMFASDAYIYFPGGFGTLDEFFELITLIKTRKVNRVPVILYHRAYWEPLLKWFDESLSKNYKTINKEDLEVMTVVDSVDEAHDTVKRLVKEYCGKEGVC